MSKRIGIFLLAIITMIGALPIEVIAAGMDDRAANLVGNTPGSLVESNDQQYSEEKNKNSETEIILESAKETAEQNNKSKKAKQTQEKESIGEVNTQAETQPMQFDVQKIQNQPQGDILREIIKNNNYGLDWNNPENYVGKEATLEENLIEGSIDYLEAPEVIGNTTFSNKIEAIINKDDTGKAESITWVYKTKTEGEASEQTNHFITIRDAGLNYPIIETRKFDTIEGENTYNPYTNITYRDIQNQIQRITTGNISSPIQEATEVNSPVPNKVTQTIVKTPILAEQNSYTLIIRTETKIGREIKNSYKTFTINTDNTITYNAVLTNGIQRENTINWLKTVVNTTDETQNFTVDLTPDNSQKVLNTIQVKKYKLTEKGYEEISAEREVKEINSLPEESAKINQIQKVEKQIESKNEMTTFGMFKIAQKTVEAEKITQENKTTEPPERQETEPIETTEEVPQIVKTAPTATASTTLAASIAAEGLEAENGVPKRQETETTIEENSSPKVEDTTETNTESKEKVEPKPETISTIPTDIIVERLNRAEDLKENFKSNTVETVELPPGEIAITELKTEIVDPKAEHTVPDGKVYKRTNPLFPGEDYEDLRRRTVPDGELKLARSSIEEFKGNLAVNKVGEYKNPIEGAVFKLESTDDKGYSKEVGKEQQLSEFKFESLSPGNYRLSEVSAPEGYAKTDKIWNVYVAPSGATFVNEKVANIEPEISVGEDISNNNIKLSGNINLTLPMQIKVGSQNANENSITINGQLLAQNVNPGDYFDLKLSKTIHYNMLQPDKPNQPPIVDKNTNSIIAVPKLIKSGSGEEKVIRYTFTNNILGINNVNLNFTLNYSTDVYGTKQNGNYDFSASIGDKIKDIQNKSVSFPEPVIKENLNLLTSFDYTNDQNGKYTQIVYVNPKGSNIVNSTSLEIRPYIDNNHLKDKYIVANISERDTNIKIYRVDSNLSNAVVFEPDRLTDVTEQFKNKITYSNEMAKVQFDNIGHEKYVVVIESNMSFPVGKIEGTYLVQSVRLIDNNTKTNVSSYSGIATNDSKSLGSGESYSSNTAKLVVENKLNSLGRFVVYKKSKNGEENLALPGAKFTLTPFNTEGETVTKESVERTGKVIFENLKPGKYILQETEAPEGYKKTEEKWTVEVGLDGKTTILQNDVTTALSDVGIVDRIREIFQPNKNEGSLLKKEIILENINSIIENGFKLSQTIQATDKPNKYKVIGNIEKVAEDLEMVIVFEDTTKSSYRYGDDQFYKDRISELIRYTAKQNPKSKFTVIGVNSAATKYVDRLDEDSAINKLNSSTFKNASTRKGIPQAFSMAQSVFSASNARQKVLLHISGYSLYPDWDIKNDQIVSNSSNSLNEMKNNGVFLRQLVEVNPTNSNKYLNANESTYPWRTYFDKVSTIYDTHKYNISSITNEHNPQYFGNYQEKLNTLVSDVKTEINLLISPNSNLSISNAKVVNTSNVLKLDGSKEVLSPFKDRFDFEYDLEINDLSVNITSMGINNVAKLFYNQTNENSINFPIPKITIPRIDVKVKKIWKDTEDSEKSQVTVKLLAESENRQGIDLKNLGINQSTQTLNSPNWEGNFTGLPQFTKGGERIRYSIVEESLDNQKADFEVLYFYSGIDSNVQIVNTKVPEIIVYNKKKDTIEKGKFTINKTDEDGQTITGQAEFKLSKKTTHVSSILAQEYQVKGAFEDQTKTTKDGKVDFDNLPPGTYDLEETKSPDGYIKDMRKFVVVVQNDGKTFIVDADKYKPEDYPLDREINKPNVDIDLAKPERGSKNLDGEISVLDYSVFKYNNESDRTIDPSLYQSMWMKFKLVFPEDVKPKDIFTIKLDDEVDMKGWAVNHKVQKDIVDQDGTTVIAKHIDTRLDGNNWIFTYQMQDAVKDRYGIAIEMQRPLFVNPDVVGEPRNIEVVNTIAGKTMESKQFSVQYSNYKTQGYDRNSVGINMFKNSVNNTVDIYGYVVVSDNNKNNNEKFTLQGSNLNFENADVKVYEVSNPSNHYDEQVQGMPKSYGPKLMDLKNLVSGEIVTEKQGHYLTIDLGNNHQGKAYIIKVTTSTTNSNSQITATAMLSNYESYKREIGAVQGSNTAISYNLNEITLQKKDERGLPLTGAKFKLTGLESSTQGYAQIRTSGKDGRLEFGALKDGRYYLEEIQAPFGFERDNTKYTLYISFVENNKQIIVEDLRSNNGLLTVENNSLNLIAKNKKSEYKPPEVDFANYKNEITFYKVDAQGNSLNGAKFKLFKGDIEVENSEKAGSVIRYEKLSSGNYLVKETQTPEDFSAPADQTAASFTVKEDGTITNIMIYNGTKLVESNEDIHKVTNTKFSGKGKFTLKKNDENQQFILGSEFTLSKKENEKLPESFESVKKKIEDVNGIEFTGLLPGLYILKETKSPDGYKASDDYVVIVHQSGNTQVIEKKIFDQLDRSILKEETDPEELFNINNNSVEMSRPAKLLQNLEVYDYELVSSNSKDPGIVRPNYGEYLITRFKIKIPAEAKEGDYFYTTFDERLNRLGNKLFEGNIQPIKSYTGEELIRISNKNGDNTYKYILTEKVNNKQDFEIELELPLYVNRNVVKENSILDIVNIIPSTGKDTEEAKQADAKAQISRKIRVDYSGFSQKANNGDDYVGSAIYYDPTTFTAESYIYLYGSKEAGDKISSNIYSRFQGLKSSMNLFSEDPSIEVYKVNKPFTKVDGTEYKLDPETMPESFGLDSNWIASKIESRSITKLSENAYSLGFTRQKESSDYGYRWHLDINDDTNNERVEAYGYIVKVNSKYDPYSENPLRIVAGLRKSNYYNYTKSNVAFDNEIINASPSASIKSTNSIKLLKVDENGSMISDTIFKLTSVKGEEVYSQYGKTDEKGQIIFGKIKAGDYNLEEIVTAHGYEKPSSGWKISVVKDEKTGVITSVQSTPQLRIDNNTEGGIYEITVTNKKSDDNNTSRNVINYPNKITFYKVGEEGIPIIGAEFKLLRNNDSSYVQERIIGEDNKIGEISFEKLSPGDYTLYETKVPEGYSSVANSGKVASFKVTSNGKITEVKTLGESGKIEDSKGTHIIVNKISEIKLKIEKRDGLDNNLLGGAKFELYVEDSGERKQITIKRVVKNDKLGEKANYETEQSEWETQLIEGDGKGTVIIEGLLDGIYWLKETKAPEGYVAYGDFIGPIKIQGGKVNVPIEQKEPLTLKIENENSENPVNVATVTNRKPVYPSTGGMGTVPFVGAGVSLMALAWYELRKRKYDNKGGGIN